MSSMSPSSVLFSSDGYELAVVSGSPFIAGTRSILFAGNDGTNTRTVLIDSTGRQVVVGAGTAGTPTGGVLTIQGDPAMTPVIVNQGTSPWVISGTVSVSGTVAVTQSTSPWVVSGTVTSNQGTPNSLANAWPITITDGYGNIQGSAPNPIYVTGTISATNPSVGTDGAAFLGFDTQVGGKTTTAAPTYTNGNLDALSLTTLGGLRIDGVYATGTVNATAADAIVSGGYVTTTPPTYTTGQLNALSLTTAGDLRVFADGYATTAAPTYTNNTSNPLSLDLAGNLRVTGFVTTNKATNSTVSAVTPTANANTTLLASNATRVFAAVFNGTNKTLYIKLGATASTSSFTTQLFSGSYWEIPNDYTGIIDTFMPAGGTGSAQVTELTP